MSYSMSRGIALMLPPDQVKEKHEQQILSPDLDLA